MSEFAAACRTLFERHPDPTALLDAGFVILEQNRASLAQFGAGRQTPCHRLQFGRETPCPGCRAGEAVRDGTPVRWMMQMADPSAVDRPGPIWEVTLLPVTDDAGRVTHFIELLHDVTLALGLEQHLIELAHNLDQQIASQISEAEELTHRSRALQGEIDRLTEAQAGLLQTERMVALGRVVAGVAHEIHTPLGAILSTLELVRTRMQGASAAELSDLLDLIQDAGERIRKVVRTLRVFSRLDAAVVDKVDLHEGLDSSIEMLGFEMRHRIRVEREYGKLPVVRCRSDQINQIFLNILRNAVQAILGSGTIRVRTFTEGGKAVVEIEDDGPGIAEENLERIFDAGFTTKAPGEGTGWGLSICRRIVREHHGEITAHNAPAHGAIFRITLPAEGPH